MKKHEMVVTNNPNPKNPYEVSFEQRQAELDAMDAKEQEQQERAKKSPFARFYQVNKDNSHFLRECLDANPTALKVLIFIFEHMDKYNAVICSYAVFQEVLGLSQATIARAIKYLKNNGFLYVYKSGTSNVYVANKDLVWTSWGSNVKYCEFPANVVLSSSEQETTDGKKTVRDKRVSSVEIKV
jgi:DNA-binding transcriptional ArsR family regulator